MLQEIEQLLTIQDRDRKIRALKNEIKLAPLQRKDLDARLAAAQQQLDAVKLKGKEIEVDLYRCALKRWGETPAEHSEK